MKVRATAIAMPCAASQPPFSRLCRLLVEHTITTGFVEPDCRPVGLEVLVALAARGATGMLKPRSFGSAAESRRPRKGSPVMGAVTLLIEVGQWQHC